MTDAVPIVHPAESDMALSSPIGIVSAKSMITRVAVGALRSTPPGSSDATSVRTASV
ncbi:hypothetical protein ACFPRL_32055 [Pseudoclavibacter helvolus]